jgi:AraC-like DNA-binding protein
MVVSNKLSAPPITRLAHPFAFAAFLRHIGAPVETHLHSQGLPTLCDDPNAFVPVDRAWGFFDTAAKHEDIMLGWYVGQFVGDHNLNRQLLKQLEGAPTLYQALQQLVSMVGSEASHLRLGIRERAHDIVFWTKYSVLRESPGYVSSQSYQLGVYLGLIRHFLGGQWVPPEIGFEHPASSGVVESLFPGARIRPGQQVGYLVVPRSFLHTPAPGVNRENAGKADMVIAENLDFVEALRLLLRSYIADGYVAEQCMASMLDTSVRTLKRRLSERGLSYRSLLDEVRFDTAKEMLRRPGAKIIDVSRSVGFEDQSHFTRMFRRIGGLTPREFRRVSQSSQGSSE